MPQKPLSTDALRSVYELVKTHRGNVAEAGRSAGLTAGTFSSRWVRAKAWAEAEGMPTEFRPSTIVTPDNPSDPEIDGPVANSLFDQRWETFNKWIGRSQASVKPTRKQKAHDTRRVILHTGDWHIPHMNEAAFHATLDANRDADVCLVGGDALNCSAFSRFIETELVNPKDEFAKLTLALQAVSERYPVVYVNVGNHPDRIRKYLAKRLDPWAMFLCQVNPIGFVVEGLRREHGVNHIHVAKPAVLEHEGSNWLTMIGDCVFTHAETHSKLHLRPAENTARWLRKWDRHLPVRPRVVVQEHNHRGGLFYDDELQCLLIQAPCLSQDVPYQTMGDLKYSPNQRGYVRVVQDDGVTMINESRFFLLDDDGESRAA
jgi:hypothetical protein